MPPRPVFSQAALRRIRTVLVRPSTPENVGMVARSLRCMGLSDLCLISPQFDLFDSKSRSNNGIRSSGANPSKIHPKAKKTASGAVDILRNTKVVDTWEDAVDDCSLMIGATSRPLTEDMHARESNKRGAKPVYSPRQSADMLVHDIKHRDKSVAVVFGPEYGGLSEDELEKCHAYLTIPTDPTFPSLNLAMSVHIWAYEVRMSSLSKSHI